MDEVIAVGGGALAAAATVAIATRVVQHQKVVRAKNARRSRIQQLRQETIALPLDTARDRAFEVLQDARLWRCVPSKRGAAEDQRLAKVGSTIRTLFTHYDIIESANHRVRMSRASIGPFVSDGSLLTLGTFGDGYTYLVSRPNAEEVYELAGHVLIDARDLQRTRLPSIYHWLIVESACL